MLVNVQSPYWFAIGCRGVFSLGGWTPRVQPGFPEPEFTRGLASSRLQGFHLLWRVIQTLRSIPGLSAFDRLYSRNCGCFLFLQLLRCFTSLRSLFVPIHSEQSTPKGGLPHSEIPGSLFVYQLPWAYRRLPRPSSPLDTKSSTMRPYSVIPTGCRRLVATRLSTHFDFHRSDWLFPTRCAFHHLVPLLPSASHFTFLSVDEALGKLPLRQ